MEKKNESSQPAQPSNQSPKPQQLTPELAAIIAAETARLEALSRAIHTYPCLDATTEITFTTGRIQIRQSSLLGFIVPMVNVAPLKDNPIHKTQLLGIRGTYANRDYLTKTDFQTLASLFRRYAESYIEHLRFRKEDEIPFQACLLETHEFEKYIHEVAEQNRNASYQGNFEFRRRV